MFKVLKNSKRSAARLGILDTAHGKIKTPFFMPVATQGTVKHITAEEMRGMGAQILLSNTYHLMLRPGESYVKKMGGLHKFMDWNGPILTDSGGFQIFSLAKGRNRKGESLVKIKKDGVEFKSFVDGRKYFMTPESSLKVQIDLGVDIAVCLDECAPSRSGREYMEKSINLTTEWARRAKRHHEKHKGKKPLLFCVIQGGLDKELRLKSLRDLIEVGFSASGQRRTQRGGLASPRSSLTGGWDGYNIGGLAVGETNKEMYETLDFLVPEIPEDKTRYLMGVGYPENIFEAVKRGVDMFDCVIPTREGRHGRLFLWKNKKEFLNSKQKADSFYKTVTITNAKIASDKAPINKDSKFAPLRNLSRAYLHYLFKIKEPLGARLASLNNLEFYIDMMERIRYSIQRGEF
ncbi:hypothetical protein A2331_04155 [Candidatus Falkowbacteria bacterium RIFOXYB2_FULL_34_18]|uniref:Queuine tRNA-ribosyltransferase n=1 Tax=Candidatus Falkowbacteria bacterium RIFOXYD2_FULL_34_120 TaxID=1798007 RepID=A0A1F5TRY3_9BACT|nr:MAG: hypothetical protein A2331_04155 [Candidatus Falkowbacteria bacterium RIFOXYB2_FULL_34_18]OGF29714.1 MAG: hypothetical protein A2500_00370 [Candidatus Falkowbacteria bacterium RIFOXYC12_FULL_34_55]OGF37421.1 MAG: hypothetical protein A2466_00350 [Candidatus Falkowbacteria bacterium RIFOXYC2_FULL_34_220]OGF39146.1 MAG: hypothetical protein A2515_00305 [Candidatus Falkowbacteria bacterium RIFOXYD12_FULL_34_57]OGF41695.1 MAG: hypothetical protein A2531_06025 [Candidatus Falkowbacteria bact